MTRELTTLEYALLGLIHREPQSGYDLRKVFETSPLGHYSSSPGAIYPALKRLRGRGLILAKVDRTRPLRPREVFQLKPAGLRALTEWLTAAPVGESLVADMGASLLRFAFMGAVATPTQSRTFLSVLADAAQKYADDLADLAATMTEPDALHGRLALESGVEEFRSRARWARAALSHFPSGA